MRVAFVLLICAAALASCDSSTSPVAPAPTPPPPVAMPMPDETARYSVTFEATWSAATHPNMFPGNPHFSPLIGATHQNGLRLWESGGIASNGIEAMAELGATSPFDQEIQRAIDSDRAQHLLRGGGIARSPDSVRLDFDISVEHPTVTLVSMLAPSPDWFVGVHNLSLMTNGDWADELVVDLPTYDAGTDDGNTYSARDRDTSPREGIQVITTAPLAMGGVAPPVGTFTFRRLR